jgi:tRNA(Ile)-lysidine synthase
MAKFFPGEEAGMKKRILDYIQENQMIRPGDTVCAGFSGGADSVLLLLVLQELADELHFRLQAVHVNHGLRGEESDGDQAFAEAFCRERNIPLFVVSCPVAALAEQEHLGLEEAGRLARRKVFADCLQERGADRIALAHHQNDLAETLLFHLARGTSLRGLASIRPVSGPLIRPLLCVSRMEIEEELQKRRISWRTDSTNSCVEYTRNRIRHEVMPLLEKGINPRAVAHMAETAEDLAGADAFLRAEAVRRLETEAERSGSGWLLKEEIKKEPVILKKYMIMACLEDLAGSRKNLTREHVAMIAGLMDRKAGKQAVLPGGITGRRTGRGVLLEKSEGPDRAEEKPEIRECPVTGSGVFSVGKWQVSCAVSGEIPEKIPQKKYTKWLDYDRIKTGLVLRTRKKGDYLVINAEGGKKKLKDYLIDCKIPAEKRDGILLLASGSEVLWVVGCRISENCKVSGDTRQVLRIEVTGGNTDE